MPDEETLSETYGSTSSESTEGDIPPVSLEESSPQIELLKQLNPGLFIDYGCGLYGSLLRHVDALGWKVIGVEFDEQLASLARKYTGLPVVAQRSEFLAESKCIADVLHLGDVLEHITDLDNQMPGMLALIKPGGFLVAAGPLEANATVFNLVLRSVRSIRKRWHRTEVAPKHVILATARGQRALFQRFNLEEVRFSISEDPWPAPATISLPDFKQPRKLGLYFLGRVSRFFASLHPDKLGNRYFYVGRFNV